MRDTILIALIFAWAQPSLSHSESHSGVDARNRVALQAEATREIPNDWTTARLSVVAEGKDPAAITSSVNRTMAKAIEAAKRVTGVEIESGAYVTQPVYDDARVVRWRASQILRLESGDVDRLALLIGDLQGDSVLLSGIEFSVKPETRSALEEELVREALAAFRARATLIATGMGEKSWSLILLSVGPSGGQPRMLQMRAESNMMSMSNSAAPVFEAGTSELRVQVSGTVELD